MLGEHVASLAEEVSDADGFVRTYQGDTLSFHFPGFQSSDENSNTQTPSLASSSEVQGQGRGEGGLGGGGGAHGVTSCRTGGQGYGFYRCWRGNVLRANQWGSVSFGQMTE